MSSETDALIDLLVQLKKIVGTVPDEAKGLLTSQPQLAYSLIQLMVKMNLLNAEVLQKTLQSSVGNPPPQPPPSVSQPPPLPGLSHPPPVIANGHSQLLPGFQQYPSQQPYQMPPLHAPPPAPAYANPAPAPAPAPAAHHLPVNAQAMLAAIPEDQKNMILQILSYTPEQISQLAPAERATFVQLRATFGVGS